MNTTDKIRQLERRGNLAKYEEFIRQCSDDGISLLPWQKRLTALRCSYLKREDCVNLLEGIGIQCYDDEPDSVLRTAVKVNILDGSLTL